MTEAGTGEVRSAVFRPALGAATYGLELAIIAVSVFGFAASVQLLPALNPTATLLWPPTGVALAIILLRGYRAWPAILAGSIFAHALSSGAMTSPTRPSPDHYWSRARSESAPRSPHWPDHGCSIAGHPVTRLSKRPHGSPNSLFICLVPTALVGSSLVVGALILGDDFGLADPLANPLGTFITWWLADAAGTVIVAPVIVLWVTTPLSPPSKSAALEVIAVFIAAAVIGIVAYSPLLGGDANDPLLPYRALVGFLIVLPLMWLGLRGGQRDTATAAFIFCGIAVWGFSAGTGSFPSADLNASLLLLLMLSTSTSVASLVLGAAIASHRDTQARLLSTQDQLQLQLEQTRPAFASAKRHFRFSSTASPTMPFTCSTLRTRRQLEQQRAAHHRLQAGRNHRQVFRHILPPDERRAGEPNRALELAVETASTKWKGGAFERTARRSSSPAR